MLDGRGMKEIFYIGDVYGLTGRSQGLGGGHRRTTGFAEPGDMVPISGKASGEGSAEALAGEPPYGGAGFAVHRLTAAAPNVEHGGWGGRGLPEAVRRQVRGVAGEGSAEAVAGEPPYGGAGFAVHRLTAAAPNVDVACGI